MKRFLFAAALLVSAVIMPAQADPVLYGRSTSGLLVLLGNDEGVCPEANHYPVIAYNADAKPVAFGCWTVVESQVVIRWADGTETKANPLVFRPVPQLELNPNETFR